MLILAFITKHTNFDATIVIWIIGLPSIAFIVMMNTDEKYKILLINSNLYESM